MMARGYQMNFASEHPEMYSDALRVRKANTMRLILQEALGERLATASVLNIGCSTGIVDTELAPAVGSLLGIDIDADAVAYAQAHVQVPNAIFRVGDAMQIDVPDASFDVVICAQVYEHVPDPRRLMSEIERVLRSNGICYFAATNRLNPMEQHYHLPFLSVIPVPLAHVYLRLLGRGGYYYERHLSWWGLRRLVAPFDVDDVTPRVLLDPERYGAGYLFPKGRLRLARFVRATAYWAFPGYIWLLRKRPVPTGKRGA